LNLFKNGQSLSRTILFCLLLQLINIILVECLAANISFSTTTTGQAGYGAKYWGQTFTVPAGDTGTITSISNMTLVCYGSAAIPTGQVKIYDSRSKAVLLGTSTNTATLTSCPSGFGTNVNYTANFSGIQVNAGQQYYFEFTYLTGSGNLYFYEDLNSSYTGGTAYRALMDRITRKEGKRNS